MPPKKKTSQTISLNEFLADQASGSWADEEAQIPTVPVASISRDTENYSQNRNHRHQQQQSSFARPSRGPREFSQTRGHERSFEQKSVPNDPPFVAYVGNLPHASTELELENYFSSLKISSIRLVKDRETGSSRGFAYIEFKDKASLESALKMHNQEFHGRNLRMDVADSSNTRPARAERSFGGDRSGGYAGREREPEDERLAGPWRRDGTAPRIAPTARTPRERSNGAHGDQPPRRTRDNEPLVDLGAFRRGEKSVTPASNWGSRPRNDEEQRPKRPTGGYQSGGGRQPFNRKPEVEEKEQELEKKIFALRFGNNK